MEYRGTLNLSVSNEIITVPVFVTHNEQDRDDEITVRIEYSGKEYLGKGKYREWTDAFANLQKALPINVEIQCCLTCRHGTLCPYGNLPNYVLCSKAEKINSKDDVIEWLDRIDAKDVEKSSLEFCEAFEVSNEKHYTYNDYLYFLTH